MRVAIVMCVALVAGCSSSPSSAPHGEAEPEAGTAVLGVPPCPTRWFWVENLEVFSASTAGCFVELGGSDTTFGALPPDVQSHTLDPLHQVTPASAVHVGVWESADYHGLTIDTVPASWSNALACPKQLVMQ